MLLNKYLACFKYVQETILKVAYSVNTKSNFNMYRKNYNVKN